LSTSGHDRSEKQYRAEIGNDGQSHDPRPTAFLHATMMVDVGSSTQAERYGEWRAGVGMRSEGRTPQTTERSKDVALQPSGVFIGGASGTRSTRLTADAMKTPNAAQPIRSSGKWAATYIRTTGTTIASTIATLRQERPMKANTMIVIAHATAAWPDG
jgi:hypothetical protein